MARLRRDLSTQLNGYDRPARYPGTSDETVVIPNKRYYCGPGETRI